jgi:hypothetical protein
MKQKRQSNLSPREKAQAALLALNSKPTVRPVDPASDPEVVAAAADAERAQRLKANAARHVENARVIDEVMAVASPREQREVMRRVMGNPKWSAEQLDDGTAYSETLAEIRDEQNQ